MEQNRFDLIEIIKILKGRSKTILLFTILGLAVSIIFVLIRKNVYTSETNLMVKSFMYFDRNQMFSEDAFYVRDVFAKEDEVDKAMTILKSNDVKGYILEQTDYAKVKNLNPVQAAKSLENAYKVKRTDNSDIEVKFTDTDPKFAYKAINAALFKAEDIYARFFEDFNKDVTEQIDFKRKLLVDSIDLVNKQIAEVRKSYNIYSILAPVRGTTVLNNNPSMNESNAEGVEKLQTLIKVKDKLDEENAKLTSLKSQYNSYLNESKMHTFYKIGGPYESNVPSNLKAWIVIAASTIAAFIFASIWVMFGNAYRKRA